MDKLLSLFTLFLGCLEIHYISCGLSFLKDTTLTTKQAKILHEFKDDVGPHLYKDWMKEEIYLVRFLRAQKFHVSQAKEMLLKDLRWRKEIRLDEAHEEDWSYFRNEYPYHSDAKDREGRPDCGEWDLRRADVAGQMPELTRYTMKIMDEGGMKVREYAAKGANVTRWTLVMNFDKVNAVQHMTPGAIQFALAIATAAEHHFAQILDEVIAINTPVVYGTVISLIRPILSVETNKMFRVFGKDPKVWGPQLRIKIDPAELPPEFGGTRYYEDQL